MDINKRLKQLERHALPGIETEADFVATWAEADDISRALWLSDAELAKAGILPPDEAAAALRRLDWLEKGGGWQ